MVHSTRGHKYGVRPCPQQNFVSREGSALQASALQHHQRVPWLYEVGAGAGGAVGMARFQSEVGRIQYDACTPLLHSSGDQGSDRTVTPWEIVPGLSDIRLW